ncbi:hypothetical protein D3C71_2099760 [compost metagenome]
MKTDYGIQRLSNLHPEVGEIVSIYLLSNLRSCVFQPDAVRIKKVDQHVTIGCY